MKEEIWKEIKGYEGLYDISNAGRVRSLKKILKPVVYGCNYYVVNLSKNGKVRTKTIHRLIAEHYISNPLSKRTVNHINGIKTDNRIENLEWATDSENNQHAFDTGLRKGRKGGKPIIAIKDMALLEFENSVMCAKELGVSPKSVRQAIKHPCKCKGYKIYEI